MPPKPKCACHPKRPAKGLAVLQRFEPGPGLVFEKSINVCQECWDMLRTPWTDRVVEAATA